MVVMDELEKDYEPVIFSHKLHAEMSSMGHGCLDCHHFSDINRITSCSECHPVGISSENLRQPGLRGAYHRQCLSCHEEWAGESRCEVCHAKKTEGMAAEIADSTVPRPSRHYPELNEPDMKVWKSGYGGETIVTLHHRNHTELYGIECAACHHAEGCDFCHAQNKQQQPVRHSEAALHATCNACHEEMSCDQCHLKEIAPEFSHNRTGWPLKRYHSKVTCRACHGTPYHFTKPSSRCQACHHGWDAGSFDHSVTGVTLNEIHIEADCSDCHTTGDYSVTPTCSGCHDEDVTYPALLPGSRL